MNYKARQEEFDVIKWYDSILAGEDRCGTYDFCEQCRKEEPYPCARAQYRHEKGYVRIAIIHRRIGVL